MLIGFISDLHATLDPVQRAIDQLHAKGVDEIYCCGDICGYGSQVNAVIDCLRDNAIQSIGGNHDRWIIKQAGNTWQSNPVKVWNYSRGSFDLIEISDVNKRYIANLPSTIRLSPGQHKLLIVHAEPPNVDDSEGIQLLDYDTRVVNEIVKDWWEGELARYDFDVLVVGHTHQYFAQYVGDTLIVNPGSTLFNGTYCYLDTDTLLVQHETIYGSAQELARMWSANGIDQRWINEL